MDLSGLASEFMENNRRRLAALQAKSLVNHNTSRFPSSFVFPPNNLSSPPVFLPSGSLESALVSLAFLTPSYRPFTVSDSWTLLHSLD